MQAVTLKPHIFDNRDALKFDLFEGASISDFIAEAKLPYALRDHVRADLNGTPVAVVDFDLSLHENDIVNIYIVPMGGDSGKAILRLIAVIAVVVTAGALAPIVGGALGGAFATSAGIASLTAGFSALGMLAVNALIPPPTLNTGEYNSASPATAYTITGQSNAMSPYGVIPRLYGTHLFFPRLCVQPLVWNAYKSSYMTAVYDFGYAELEIGDLRIGNTSIDNYDTNTNYLPSTKGEGLKYFTKKVSTQNIGLELLANDTIVRDTALDTKMAEVEISLPSGLVEITDAGDYLKTAVSVEVSYRISGSSDSLSTVNIVEYGHGVLRNGIPKHVSVELPIYNDNPHIYQLSTSATIIKANLTSPLYKGDRIYNKANLSDYGGREFRTITKNVPVGNNVTITIDRPFTNFVRTGYWEDNFFITIVLPKANVIAVSNNTVDANTILARITFPTVDKYEVHVKRVTADSDDSQLINTTYWGLFRSFEYDDVLELDTEHSLMELNLKANEQINGVVENLNAICKSKLRAWNGTAFNTTATDNPAWIVLDILTGSANDGAIPLEQIDLNSFKDFSDYCNELITVSPAGEDSFTQKRHRCSAVISNLTTVSDLVQSILSQARASLKISANGKYGVLFDVVKTQPVQLFTTRNSSGFSSDRTYADIPHAVKVKYVNPLRSYEIDEVIVYADGYSLINATKFETIETFGITDYYEAWRHGRYTLAQMISYQETFSISVDLEHLSVQRGELVSVQNDVPKIGGLPLRVKAVQDGGLTIVLNDDLTTDGVSEYHYLVRADDLSIETGAIDTLIDKNTVVLAVPNPNIKVNDVFVYGFKDYVTKDYLVTAISPNADLKANISLVPYDPAVYTADVGEMPAYTSGIAPELTNVCRVEIEDLTLNYDVTIDNRLPIPTFNLEWNVSSTGAVKNYLVEWASTALSGRDYVTAGYTEDTNFTFKLGNLVDNPELLGNTISFRVTTVNILDIACISSAPVSTEILPDQTIPSDVPFFNCNIVNETLNLTWHAVQDRDIQSYIIKYHASTNPLIATWDRSVLLTDRISYDTLRHTTNARKGTYLIKAIDTSNNISETASRAVTSVPEIVNLNFVEKVDNSTAWVGEKENLVVENSELKTDIITAVPTCIYTMCGGIWRDTKTWSDTIVWDDVPYDYSGTDYAKSGRYTFDNLVDLGEIYTPRISTNLDAYASKSEELIYTWVRLSDIKSLGSISYDLWNAYIVVKMASFLGTISNWTTLSSVATLAEGGGSDWTEEALSEIGDFTGRYFRFYLIIETQTEKIRVNVDSAIVNIDMPDRIISDNDILSAVGGTRIDFDKPFYVSPALGITQDNATKGDRYAITNKDRTGFNIEFFDTIDASVIRQFDYMAKAYGTISDTLI